MEEPQSPSPLATVIPGRSQTGPVLDAFVSETLSNVHRNSSTNMCMGSREPRSYAVGSSIKKKSHQRLRKDGCLFFVKRGTAVDPVQRDDIQAGHRATACSTFTNHTAIITRPIAARPGRIHPCIGGPIAFQPQTSAKDNWDPLDIPISERRWHPVGCSEKNRTSKR